MDGKLKPSKWRWVGSFSWKSESHLVSVISATHRVQLIRSYKICSNHKPSKSMCNSCLLTDLIEINMIRMSHALSAVSPCSVINRHSKCIPASVRCLFFSIFTSVEPEYDLIFTFFLRISTRRNMHNKPYERMMKIQTSVHDVFGYACQSLYASMTLRHRIHRNESIFNVKVIRMPEAFTVDHHQNCQWHHFLCQSDSWLVCLFVSAIIFAYFGRFNFSIVASFFSIYFWSFCAYE